MKNKITLHTSQKGITLITLIITIIVMLILVGVTINVALNGGLFTKASEASEQMQIKTEEEELLSAVVASIGTDGKVENIVLPAGWSKLADGNYRSPKDNMYKVDDYGKIEYIGKYTGGGTEQGAFSWESVGLKNIDTNTEYISGDGTSLTFSTDGKITRIRKGKLESTIDATKYTDIGIIDFTEELEVCKVRTKVEMNGNKNDIDLILIYLNEDGITEIGTQADTYVKVKLESGNVYSNEEVLQALGEVGGTYKGTWTKIGTDENGNAKLVSTSSVAYCKLGETDDLEKSTSDYKNVVSILNTTAKTATGIDSARSINVEDIYGIIGEGNIDKGQEYGKVYNYYYETKYSSQTFVDDNGNIVVLDSPGDEVTLTHTEYDYNLTDEQKAQIGTLALGEYWLASPCVSCGSYNAYFYMQDMKYGNIRSKYYLFCSDGEAYYHDNGVRAVVSVSGL